jgi:predicted RNA-binding Zn-ribbon protein involved in translation (DUF1610 family)
VRLKLFRAATLRKENTMGLQQNVEIENLVGAYPVCGKCGQTRIVRDAWAYWSLLTRSWTLKTVFDGFSCDNCGGEVTPVWKVDKTFRLKRIVRLNDALRRGQDKHNTIVVTAGLQQFGEAYLARVCQAVAGFDQFCEANDPHREHDFGAITIDGTKLFWKIDYFNLEMNAHSLDKANEDITHRVLTIMLSSEY